MNIFVTIRGKSCYRYIKIIYNYFSNLFLSVNPLTWNFLKIFHKF
jgi:hypothetical protein